MSDRHEKPVRIATPALHGFSVPPCAPWLKSFSLLAHALLIFLFILPLSLSASAQANSDETILIDTNINYGVAFRENAWSPVDVFVNNTERDVEGFVEVRTFDFSGNPLSPVYRLPVASPKGSRKHFRLYCKFERANRMEVQLYHGNRPAVPVPSWLNLTPIERKDYLGLILDDAHHDYGFLSSNDVIGRDETRFHREGLTTDQLGLLADNPACYSAFDLIVFGDIDPERIGPAQREILEQFVSLGGTLVVSLGENATRYNDSWLEPLMGVAIGENTFTTEDELSLSAFGATSTVSRTHEPPQGMVTKITPVNSNVRPIGASFAAGAINPLGAGKVATFTVGATSGLLQENRAFLQEWSHLLANGVVERPLNLPALVNVATEQLPAIAGVKLFPVSSVITYLLLYFFIAIVGNWLFWNWMKRREMAWVCLVFFSFVFTAYAMFFGTQGRARTTQLEQLEVLELSAGNSDGTLHGITGLLAKGSGRFRATLPRPQTLVTDAASAQIYDLNQPRGVFGPQGQNPFQFIEGEEARIENLTVGASEMRFLQTQTPLELPGAINADLALVDGKLQGTIINETGLALENPLLFHGGKIYTLLWSGTSARVESGKMDYTGGSNQGLRLSPVHAATVPEDIPPNERQQFNSFLSTMPQWLFSGTVAQGRSFFIAWVDAPPFGTVEMGDRAEIQLGATLMVTWLDVGYGDLPDAIDLSLSMDSQYMIQDPYAQNIYMQDPYGRSFPAPASSEVFPAGLPETDSAWHLQMRALQAGEQWPLDLAIPQGMRVSDGYALQLTVVTADTAFEGHHESNCSPVGGNSRDTKPTMTVRERDQRSSNWGNPSVSSKTLDNGVTLTLETYTVPDWKALLAPRSSLIHLTTDAGSVADAGGLVPGNYNRRGEHYHAYIAARMIKLPTQTAGE